MAIIAAFRPGETRTYTQSAHQYDKGQKLLVTGVALPEQFEVHISNEKDGGMATSFLATAKGVPIPDAYFATGKYVYVWIYEVSKSSGGYYYDVKENGTLLEEPDANVRNEGITTLEIVIPVIRRSIQLPTQTITYEEVAGYMVDDDHTLFPVQM